MSSPALRAVLSRRGPRTWAVLVLVASALVAGGCGEHREIPQVPKPAPPLSPPSAPPEESVEPEVPEGILHVVERGQTLWRIARAYGVPMGDLVEANGIADPSRLSVGQVLFVPGAETTLDVPPYPAPVPGPGEVDTIRVGIRDTGFIWPLEGATVISYFGAPRRTHRHKGLDLRGRHGQLVRAARSGRVIYSGATMRGYGKAVVVDHGDGLQTLYAHNSELLVRVGDRVERGERIARVGRTGNATAEHCHFEIRKNRVPVDPMLYLPGVAEDRP